MLSDIEIAESATLCDIREVAQKLGLTENELELYGKYKAKIFKLIFHLRSQIIRNII